MQLMKKGMCCMKRLWWFLFAWVIWLPQFIIDNREDDVGEECGIFCGLFVAIGIAVPLSVAYYIFLLGGNACLYVGVGFLAYFTIGMVAHCIHKATWGGEGVIHNLSEDDES